MRKNRQKRPLLNRLLSFKWRKEAEWRLPRKPKEEPYRNSLPVDPEGLSRFLENPHWAFLKDWLSEGYDAHLALLLNCPPESREKMAGYQMACKWFHEMSNGGIESALTKEVLELAKQRAQEG